MKNREYPLYKRTRPSGIPDMLRTIAGQRPDGIAFRFRKGRDTVETKTYTEVLHEVKKAACWTEQTFGSGKHIAIIGENSYEWILAFFTVLSSGNVAVLIDKELPAAEVERLISKAGAGAAFVSKTYSDLVGNVEGLNIVTFRELTSSEGENADEYRLHDPEEEEAACIFFTSGTSGRSKGVLLTHGNLSWEIYGPASLFDPEGTSTLAVLPFHHTFGLNVAVLSAYNIGVSIFINKSLKKVKDDLLLARPDTIMLVPMFVEVFYKQIMDGIRKSGREKKVKAGIRLGNLLLRAGIDIRRRIFREVLDSFGGNLKFIICGGAHLDPFYVRAFRNFGIEILNGYGTTECSPCVAVNRNYYKRDGSVGLLIPGMEMRISSGGEVQFKGPVVMKGYYDEPEETAEVLHDGWYSTGDLGYVDDDGFLFLTGRIKNLIILSNGENISPEELENDFHEDRAVNEVLVYEKDQKIIAEIFPDEEHMGDTAYFEALAERINKGRPVYKQIASVKLRNEEFIKNTSKKIVRYKNIP